MGPLIFRVFLSLFFQSSLVIMSLLYIIIEYPVNIIERSCCLARRNVFSSIRALFQLTSPRLSLFHTASYSHLRQQPCFV